MITRGIKHSFKLALLFSLFSLVTIPALPCFAQTPTPRVADKTEPNAEKSAQSTRPPQDWDHTFELNFAERRYSQTDFEAATNVETNGGSQALNLRIGVSLTADRIDVLLRNVRGSVRFRGSLDRIFAVIGKRPATSPEVP